MSDTSATAPPSWAGTSAGERRADRRRRLLAAGRDAFGTEGFAGSAISRICKAARVTERDLYAEFGGKEGLLLAVYDELVAEAVAAVDAALDGPGDDVEGTLHRAMAAFAAATTADPATARIHFVEVVGASPRVEAHRRAVLRGFARRLEAAWTGLAETGAVPRGPEPGMALAIVGAAQELLLDALSADGARGRTPDRATLERVVTTSTRVGLAVVRHA